MIAFFRALSEQVTYSNRCCRHRSADAVGHQRFELIGQRYAPGGNGWPDVQPRGQSDEFVFGALDATPPVP